MSHYSPEPYLKNTRPPKRIIYTKPNVSFSAKNRTNIQIFCKKEKIEDLKSTVVTSPFSIPYRERPNILTMVTIMIVIFILGYIFIALENKTGINKAAVALILGMLLWTLFIFSGAGTVIQANSASFSEFLAAHKEYHSLSRPEQVIKYIVNLQIIDHLGDVSEILFYLLGAMTIVELIDVHKGFEGITGQITTRNKKKLLWLIGFITFFMSSVLDNMTSAIVMIMLLQKLLDNPQERWIFGSIVIIAANAGGAWTPIGDVTTIMLWINDNITSGNIMRSLFFPSIAALALPLWIVSLQLKGNIASASGAAKEENGSPINRKERNTIFILGILCLLFVPVFKSLTHLPPLRRYFADTGFAVDLYGYLL